MNDVVPIDSTQSRVMILQTARGEVQLEKIHGVRCLPLFQSDSTNKEHEHYISRWIPHAHELDRPEVEVYLQANCEISGKSKDIDSLDGWMSRWRRFDDYLSPLATWVLEYLAHNDRQENASCPEINFMNEVMPGIRQVPLRSPTLPPAQHTNAYVLGNERVIIVDPATFIDSEREKLHQVLVNLQTQGSQLEAVVLSHHHFDHYGSAQWLSDTFGLPIWAHEITAAKLVNDLNITRFLSEGEILDLGLDCSGRPFRFELMFTPGHAPGHIVLCDLRPNSNAMVVGDMVATVGTIIVDPDDGDMAKYITELRRMLARGPKCIFPAHGPPIADGPSKLRHYIEHRLKREAKVLKALKEHGPGEAKDLLESAYSDTSATLYPLAERTCLAHLIKLEREAKIQCTDGIYEVL